MSLKAQSQTKALKVGHSVFEFVTPGIGHILKNAGCDFVFLDMEHTGFSNETVKAALRYFEAADLPCLVRVPSKDYHHIARALDMGAEGLMTPMVNDAEEARGIVNAMRYAPDGERGVALGIAHDNYRSGAVMDTLKAANERVTYFPLIETRAGVDNAAEIAALDGVDCLWIGHFDLSCSLGIPGEFDHPDFQKAVKTVKAACRKAGKALGRLVSTPEHGVALAKEGFDFICYSGDVWVLGEAVQKGVGEIRAGTKKRRRAAK